MRQIWPLIQALPLVIAFVALLGLGLQLAEVWLTQQNIIGTGFGYDGPSTAERVILMSAFMNVVINFVSNLGWAAVVFAAVRYIEGKATCCPNLSQS